MDDKVFLQRRAKIFKALGHPTRLSFVDALGRGELCVCDLQKLVGADMSTVSKHLSVLKEAGVVEDEKRGNWVFYSLRMECVTQFMHCVDATVARDLGLAPPPPHIPAMGAE